MGIKSNVLFNALRVYLNIAFLMRRGDSNKEENKELLKGLYNICQ